MRPRCRSAYHFLSSSRDGRCPAAGAESLERSRSWPGIEDKFIRSAILSGVRYLAVDFGEARIGLATSDESATLATPRRTIPRRSDEQAIEEIRRFARQEEIGEVVLGLPHHGDGSESELAPRVRSFARKLQDGTS